MKIGVEGTGTYWLGPQRVLRVTGHEVVEVNRPNRHLRPSRGKSDTVDAKSAAGAKLAGHATSIPKSRDGLAEALRVLRLVDRSAKEQMTRLDGQIEHLAVCAPESIRVGLQRLSPLVRARTMAAFRPGTDISDVARATKTAMRALARIAGPERGTHPLLRANPAARRPGEP
jgi:transposase